jgi:hypothetical protein
LSSAIADLLAAFFPSSSVMSVFSQLPLSCGCVLKLDLPIHLGMNTTSGNMHKVRQFTAESIFLSYIFDGLLLKMDFHFLISDGRTYSELRPVIVFLRVINNDNQLDATITVYY